MVQSGYLNLCIVPEIPVLIATPHSVEGFSLLQDSTSTLPDPPTSFIEPPGALVADFIEDIHDSVITPSLGIPFQDPHTFSFEHQLGLPISPLIQGLHYYGGCFGIFSISHGGLVVLMVLSKSLEPFLVQVVLGGSC